MDQFIGQFEPDDLERVRWPIIIIEISVGVDESGSHLEIRNSNIEIRNNFKIQISKFKTVLLCFGHLYFEHSCLFRISPAYHRQGFRASDFGCPKLKVALWQKSFKD